MHGNLGKLSARLDAVIDRAIGEKRLVGAVVLVAQHGEPVYRNAAGLADRERGTPMREDALFRLASLTKPIVSATAMRLVELGVIGLDDPVTRWLPDFQPRLENGEAPSLSVRALLTHSAGLSYSFFESPDGPYHRLQVSDGLDQPGLSFEENLKRIGAAPLLFAPGAGWSYSLSMDVLGGALAKAAGKTLPALVEDYVTGPLGMRDTAFSVADRARLAAAYADGEREPVLMTDGISVPLKLPIAFEGATIRFAPSRAFDLTSYPSGGAGMVGTATDFLKFLEAIRTGGAPILARDTVAAMTSPQINAAFETRGPGWSFGYGWALLVDPSLAATPQSAGTYQWGGVYGHSWFVDPARGFSVVALTNTAVEGTFGGFVIDLRDAIYG
jgi:CubicO group peptidase (beta-lactamase class C family)